MCEIILNLNQQFIRHSNSSSGGHFNQQCGTVCANFGGGHHGKHWCWTTVPYIKPVLSSHSKEDLKICFQERKLLDP